MVISSLALGVSKTYQLPLKRIKSVVVDRKSVIPFAALTVIAAILTVVIKYNAFWFLLNLTPPVSGFLSSVAFLVAIVSLVPVVLRAVFVNVIITWDGDPTTFRVGFVYMRSGKRLAKKFQESSVLREAEANG
jgi:hypothetical protein